MNLPVLQLLKQIGLIETIPDDLPPPGKPLARGVCPLHDGADNPNAFVVYADGFVCATHHCHKTREFGHNLEGLIRHMAHKVTGEVMAWRPAWAFARKNVERLKSLIEKTDARPSNKSIQRVVTWSLDDLRACLEIPDPFYVSRGYRPETLEYFSVGRCIHPLPDGNDRLVGWSIIPVLKRSHLPPLGYTARNPRWSPGGTKWIHHVAKSEALFNEQNAGWGGPLIICEGPGDVMRFFEAGLRGAVATLGASLSDQQYFSLLALMDIGRRVYIAADADETGRKFAEAAKRKLARVADPIIVFPTRGKDFGELTPQEIIARNFS